MVVHHARLYRMLYRTPRMWNVLSRILLKLIRLFVELYNEGIAWSKTKLMGCYDRSNLNKIAASWLEVLPKIFDEEGGVSAWWEVFGRTIRVRNPFILE